MTTRETLLRVAYILQEQHIDAQVECIKSRFPLLVIRDSHALRVNESGAIVVQCVRGEGDRILLRARTCRHETPEDIARLVQVRQGIVDAEEARRRAALTPEQREREDRPACAVCRLRDPLAGQDRCRVCSEARAA